MSKNCLYLSIIFVSFIFTGCTVIHRDISPSAIPPHKIGQALLFPLPGEIPVPTIRKDTLHTIAPGETLWRISKMYDVPLDQIIQTNNITNPNDLTMGDSICIPQAAQIKPIIPLYPSDKWKYIIIHHSATDEGSALSFHRFHLNRGFQGLGYHFVIDNGSQTKQDGQIEVAPRWINQSRGAHCKANGMNNIGIGICLVGNFDREEVSEKQMQSLTYLVNLLKTFYSIPKQNILGHGQVKSASTDCPGKNFPWFKFYALLDTNNKKIRYVSQYK